MASLIGQVRGLIANDWCIIVGVVWFDYLKISTIDCICFWKTPSLALIVVFSPHLMVVSFLVDGQPLKQQQSLTQWHACSILGIVILQ